MLNGKTQQQKKNHITLGYTTKTLKVRKCAWVH